MASNQVKGSLELLLMGVLQHGPAHGYAIIAALRDRSDGEFELAEGTIYPGAAPPGGVGAHHEFARGGQRPSPAHVRADRAGTPRLRHATQGVVRIRAVGRRGGGDMSDEPIEEYLDGLYGQSAHRSAQRAAAAGRGRRPPARRRGRVRGAGHDPPRCRARSGAALRRERSDRRADSRARSPRCSSTPRKAVTLLGGIGLVAIGVSGLLAGAMAALFGRQFVGGGLARSVFGGAPASVAEDAGDAVSLRVLAGLVGWSCSPGCGRCARARPQSWRCGCCPPRYVDLVALVAFASAAILLVAAQHRSDRAARR